MFLSNLFTNIFGSGSFIPHGHCYLWKPGLVWLHVISDSFIALAYYSIPIALLYFVHRRKDLPFNWLFLLFGAFIVACGTTHLMEIWTLWHPIYWFSGLLKSITAGVSVITALVLIPSIPKAIAIPNPEELRLANCQLQAQIAERQRVEAALQQSEAELRATFGAMTELILIYDAEGRHLRIAPTNPGLLYKTANERIGKTLHEIFPQQQADMFLSYIRRALETQQTVEVEYKLDIRGEEIWSAGRVSPISENEVIFVARDITAQKRAEQELRLAEQKYRSIYEHSAEGIFQTTSEGRYTSVNPALWQIYGYDSAEDLLKTVTSVQQQLYVNSDRRAEFVHLLETQDSVSNFESQVYRKDGKVIWISENARAIRNEHGELRYYEGSVQDITTRKEAEKALQTLNAELEQRVQARTAELRLTIQQLQAEITERQRAEQARLTSETQLQAIVDNAKAAIYLKDIQGRYLLVNRELERLLQLDREQIKGKTDYDIFSQEIADAFWKNDCQVIHSKASLELEEVVPLENGLHTYISIKFPLLDANGSLYAVCGISTDITDRKQAEIALRESEQRFRAIFNQAAIGISLNHVNGQWISANQRQCEILGYTQEELVTMSFQDVSHEEDLGSDLAALERLILGEISMYSLEKRYRRKDGTCIWLSLTVSLIRDSAGQPLYTLAVTEDIEQRKKAEDDIRRALQRERELSELKSQFITTVSHEFRTPLTTIISSAELLERKNLELNDPKRAKYFNNIQRGANRITHVLDDILMLMKLESETITSDSTSLNLSQFCRDIVAKWQKSAGEQYCISFVDNSTVDLIANLDASLLHQVLSHLVFNAIRYSPKGGSICIEMICKSRSVIFYVRDQGIGIPVAEQTKIFDTFYRANNADSIPGTPGAGLGLAIAAKAVALQNGTIEVNSEIGRGTTFIVSLPLS